MIGLSFDSPHFAATLRPMKKTALLLLLATVLLPACAHRPPKSTAHLYSGDAPTIKYSNRPETAGGHLQTY